MFETYKWLQGQESVDDMHHAHWAVDLAFWHAVDLAIDATVQRIAHEQSVAAAIACESKRLTGDTESDTP